MLTNFASPPLVLLADAVRVTQEVTVPVALFRVDPYPNITSLNTAFPGVNTNS